MAVTKPVTVKLTDEEQHEISRLARTLVRIMGEKAERIGGINYDDCDILRDNPPYLEAKMAAYNRAQNVDNSSLFCVLSNMANPTDNGYDLNADTINGFRRMLERSSETTFSPDTDPSFLGLSATYVMPLANRLRKVTQENSIFHLDGIHTDGKAVPSQTPAGDA